MRRPACLILSLAIAIVCTASAAGSQSTQRANQPTVVRLISTTIDARLLEDVAPKGRASRGDQVWLRSRLTNAAPQFGRAKGAVVGSDEGTFTYTGPASGSVTAVAKLPGGTLALRGPERRFGTKGGTVPVIGGTGIFAGAKGTLHVLQVSDLKAINTYRLTYATTA